MLGWTWQKHGSVGFPLRYVFDINIIPIVIFADMFHPVMFNFGLDILYCIMVYHGLSLKTLITTSYLRPLGPQVFSPTYRVATRAPIK